MRGLVALAALVLAACQTPCPAPPFASANTTFRCGDGSLMRVAFSPDAAGARVVQDGHPPVQLLRRAASSGYRYAGYGAEMRGQGALTNWIRPGAAETICQAL